MPRGLLRHLQQ